MTSNQVTEDDLLVQSQGFRTSSDIDSDLSDEEEVSPEPEELIQGSSDGFSGRGPQNADSAGNKPKKVKSDVPLPQPRKTDKPPPQNKPKPVNYPQPSKSR